MTKTRYFAPQAITRYAKTRYAINPMQCCKNPMLQKPDAAKTRCCNNLMLQKPDAAITQYTV
jgi:hypothetical protein